MIERLRWEDLAERRYDPSRARELVAEVVLPGRAEEPQRLVDEVDRRLLEEFGLWTAGWQWSATEPGGGGVVRAWCCPNHSMVAGEEGTVEGILAAVAEWRGYLEEASVRYAELREECRSLPLDRHVERAAARLLPWVIEATGTQDAWYATFAAVLGWYLQSAGLEGFEKEFMRVISGRFKSWVAPSEEDMLAVTQGVGKASLAPRPERDALTEWLKIRPRAWREFTRESSSFYAPDGHKIFIAGREHERDPFRAECMLAALEACRRDATAGLPLTFERLSYWQSLVLAEPEPGIRMTWAYAKEGREAYGVGPELLKRFEKCLADATGEDPFPVRAARVYLDLCFFHPFTDGNARAARLALDYVLTRAGRSLRAAEMLFALARSADDLQGAWYFAHMVDSLSGIQQNFSPS